MGKASEAAVSGTASGTKPGFTDSLGDRVIVAGAGQSEQIEILQLRRELTAVSSFEFALRERAARLANFQHTAYARVRQIDRLPPPDGRLAVVSEHVAGSRLIEILTAVQEQHLELDINAALCLIKQLVHAVAILHQQARGVAHGALGPERIVVTAGARLVIVEYVLGAALEQMDMTRERLWRELRVAVPPAAGGARFDARADVTQIGTIAMALVLGCPLAGDDYPDHMAELLAMATENRTLGGRRPVSKALRTWLARALQLDLHRSFRTAIEAQTELEALLTVEPSYVAAPVALETFLAAYERSSAAAAAAAAERPTPAEEVPEHTPTDARTTASEVEAREIVLVPVPAEEPSDPVIDLDSTIADLDEIFAGTAPAPAPPREPKPARQPQPANPAPSPSVQEAARAAHEAAQEAARMTHEAVRATQEPPRVAPEAPSVTREPRTRPAPPPPPQLDAGYQGGIEALLGQADPKTDAHKGGDDAIDAQLRADEPPAKRKLLPLLIAAAVIVLGVGGYFVYRQVAASAPAPTTGTLVVESQPAGLPVTIDGKPRGATPFKASLSPGQHKLEIETAGQRRTIPITITAGGQISQYIESQATPATGRLYVGSEPAGAVVIVDGERKGPAPVTVSDLAAGRHKVELQADGATVQQEVTIEPGATNSLVVPMSSARSGPVSGWVAVNAPIEVQVYEGSQLVGSSQSDRILMTAGRHELDIVNETLGLKSRQTVQVLPGKSVSVKVQLPKGSLSVNALPWAEVWVDGDRVGETPIGNLTLPIGPHEIVFRHPQLGERRYAATVTASAPARVSVDLRK